MCGIDWARLVCVFGCVVACACGSDGVGEPCAKDSDCLAGLSCDIHEYAGTCQDEHGH
jgi:hypothetical protein